MPLQDITPPSPSPPPNPTQEDDGIRPCIAELLRTGYHPTELILRVERIVDVLIPRDSTTLPTRTRASAADDHGGGSKSDHSNRHTRRSFRVYLSDGELVMQALLKSALHRFVLTGETREGMVVRVEEFEVKRAKRGGGKGGNVIYLAVGWFSHVTGCGTTDDISVEEKVLGDENTDQRKRRVFEEPEKSEDGFAVEAKRVKFESVSDEVTTQSDDFDDGDDDEFSDLISQAMEPVVRKELKMEPAQPENSFGMGAESFSGLREYMEQEDLKGMEKTEEKGQEQSNDQDPILTSSSDSPTRKIDTPKQENEQRQRRKTFTFTRPLRPVERPLNLLLLSDLVYPAKPLPKRNYLCDVFAIITSISPNVVKRPNMAPKRDLRIMDLTLGQRRPRGVQVSVFADAAGFDPPVGTIALFRSLKTHEWDGISLNAYEKDCLGRDWFISDPEKLKGYNVGALRDWWDQRGQERERERERESENNTQVGTDSQHKES